MKKIKDLSGFTAVISNNSNYIVKVKQCSLFSKSKYLSVTSKGDIVITNKEMAIELTSLQNVVDLCYEYNFGFKHGK